MSLRELVDADCGGANALMRLGTHFAQDMAHKEDGISRGFGATGSSFFGGRDPINGEATAGADQLVNEFLGQAGPMLPPQTFRMDALLQEMRDIDAGKFQPHHMRAPAVIEEVRNETEAAWANEFRDQGGSQQGQSTALPTHLSPVHHQSQLVPMINKQPMIANDFFNTISPVKLIFYLIKLYRFY